MNILIYGGKGWIGSQFCSLINKETPNVNTIHLGKARADNIQAVKEEIEEIKPTHIVSFIGRTHGKIGDKIYSTIDYLEQPGKLKENLNDNLFSPVALALLCKECDIHLTYLGTGCIFKFDDNHPFGREENGFVENSLPNFFGSGYSTAKGFTDRLMPLINGPVLNLRIRMPIVGEDNPRNFITKITTYEKICSIPNSMTVLPDFFPIILDMIHNNTTGTFNLTNPGLITHNEILEMYKEVVDPNFTWENFDIEEQNKILDGKRSNNYLDTNKIEELYPDILNIKKSVRNILELYK
jgi:3,5-epimerase/4-reductase